MAPGCVWRHFFMMERYFMSNGFHQAYEALTSFIAGHPEIEIGESVTSIPEEVRTEFYNLFNAARESFVEEKFPEYLNETSLLLAQYRAEEDKARRLFSLEETSMVTGTQRFLCDPRGTLTRELFDPLFDLLKGRESIESFEKRAAGKIEDIFPTVYRGAYELWMMLSLVELLEADKTLGVETRRLGPGERAKPSPQAPMEEVPLPSESASFFFSQPRDVIFAVPNLIAHSPKLNRFIGIRTEFSEGLYNAWYPSSNREWVPLSMDLLILLGYGLTLIYVAEQAEDIALVADASRFCRPDLILWCIDTLNLTRKEALEKMAQVDGFIQPTKGSYIIANNPWPEPADPTEPEPQTQVVDSTDAVHLLIVGYDQSKLMPIVEALVEEPSAPLTT
jgi:hypothetical protein